MGKIIDAIACKGLPARDIKNANIANLWIFAWAASLGIISYISDYEWYSSIITITITLIIHIGIGAGMMLAYRRFLKELDELERKIQLDALAFSVGSTILVFSSYSILENAGIVPELSPSILIAVLALTYSAGLIFGRIRYR